MRLTLHNVLSDTLPSTYQVYAVEPCACHQESESDIESRYTCIRYTFSTPCKKISPFFARSLSYDEWAKSGALLVSCIGFVLLQSLEMSIYTHSLFLNEHVCGVYPLDV